MRIAIAAPTGHIGSQLVKLLQGKGHELVLLARHPEKVKDVKGAKIEQGDLSDTAYLQRATKGADVFFWLTPPKLDEVDFRSYQRRLGKNAADAVRKNKIKRVVNLSSFGAHLPDGTGPIAGLYDVEALLDAACREVGGSITHLRPGSFMENFFMHLPSITKDGAIYAPISGDVAMPTIATSDIAKAAAETILDTTWTGRQVRELRGPRDLTGQEAVRIVGDAIGKPVKYVQVPPEAARVSMEAMGLSPDIARRYVEMYQAADKGILKWEQKNSVQTTPTKFEDFAKQQIAPAARPARN